MNSAHDDVEFQTNAMSALLKSIPNQEQLSKELAKAKVWLSTMEMTVQSTGFLAGCGMTFLGVTSMLGNTFGLKPLAMVSSFFLAMFGLLMCILEFKEAVVVEKYLVWIEQELHLLYTPYGRAGFYILAGILILSSDQGILGFLVGLLCLFVGGLASYSAKIAYDTLGRLLDEQFTEQSIAARFDEFDHDGSGDLDVSEMQDLCKSLNKTLTIAQLEAAVRALDRNRNGKIDKKELIDWWRSAKEDQAKGGLIGFIRSILPFKLPF